MKAPMLLALTGMSISAAQAIEPKGTVTLVCNGTQTGQRYGERISEQITLGIILDFENETVAGFGANLQIDASIKILDVDDTTVSFRFASGTHSAQWGI